MSPQPIAGPRSGSDRSTCPECHDNLVWDARDNAWVHDTTGLRECLNDAFPDT